MRQAYIDIKSKKRNGKDVNDKEWTKALGINNTQELHRRWEQGVAARDELIERNLRLVLKVAREVWARMINYREGYGSLGGIQEDVTGVGFLDLVQEGNIGLVRAAELFDPDRGVRFASYAYSHIKVFVQRAMAPLGVLIKFPLEIRIAMAKLQKYRRAFYMENGRFPTLEEESTVVPGRNIEDMRRYESVARSFASLDESIGNSSGNIQGDKAASRVDSLPSRSKAADEWLDENFARNQLEDEMKELLSEEEVKILNMRYGLGGEPPMKAHKIAEILDVTWNHVTYVCKRAKKILREHLNEETYVGLLA